ncbi:MAG: aminomethyl-transferring glycine dehydrogenase subunit GcvPA [Alphaproteobacteria bacterium]|nr:aminomethyl-transferring glycine dehydrogenase subunit GcvPA [Alphaproteobacteria bacterium]
MRYLPLINQERQEMLKKIGVSSIDQLFADVPQEAQLSKPVNLPFHQSEMEVERFMGHLARKNLGTSKVPSFLGAGAYRHHIPAVVDHLIQRGEFLTSYTPYQPEITQGTLQYLFEFQTQVALITGMDIANASMYDGATSMVEAIMMANRLTKRGKAIITGSVHPHYSETAETYAKFNGFETMVLPPDIHNTQQVHTLLTPEISCVVVQNPGFFGHLKDWSDLATQCQKVGALLIIVVTEIVSLGLLKSPGSMGADIVVGEGQSLGNGLNFGGPYLGLFATREKYLRQMPGRVAGQTVDIDGRRGWVLTLSTREQHIRREKATSNICTNSGLCALAFTIHLTLLGEEGFHRLAKHNHARILDLVKALEKLSSVKILNTSFFNEITIDLKQPASPIVDQLAAQGILAGVPASRLYTNNADVKNLLLVCATELTTQDDIDIFVQALKEIL